MYPTLRRAAQSDCNGPGLKAAGPGLGPCTAALGRKKEARGGANRKTLAAQACKAAVARVGLKGKNYNLSTGTKVPQVLQREQGMARRHASSNCSHDELRVCSTVIRRAARCDAMAWLKDWPLKQPTRALSEDSDNCLCCEGSRQRKNTNTTWDLYERKSKA